MGLIPSIHRDKRNLLLKLSIAILPGVFAATLAVAQDLTPGITYICNGERIFIENCNIRDLSIAPPAGLGTRITSCRTD